MDKLLCGLGFHQWKNLGYDMWTEKSTGSYPIFCFRLHKKCEHCQKLVVSKAADGIPPDVDIDLERNVYIDKSVEGNSEKPLLERG